MVSLRHAQGTMCGATRRMHPFEAPVQKLLAQPAVALLQRQPNLDLRSERQTAWRGTTTKTISLCLNVNHVHRRCSQSSLLSSISCVSHCLLQAAALYLLLNSGCTTVIM